MDSGVYAREETLINSKPISKQKNGPPRFLRLNSDIPLTLRVLPQYMCVTFYSNVSCFILGCPTAYK